MAKLTHVTKEQVTAGMEAFKRLADSNDVLEALLRASGEEIEHGEAATSAATAGDGPEA